MGLFSSRNIYHIRGGKTDNQAYLRTMGQQAAGQNWYRPNCPPRDRVLEEVEQLLQGCHPHFRPDAYHPSFFPEKEVPRTGAPDHLSRWSNWLDKTQRRYQHRLTCGHEEGDADKDTPLKMNKAKDIMGWLLCQGRPTVSVEEFPGILKSNITDEPHESPLETQAGPSDETYEYPVETQESLEWEDQDFPIEYYYASGRTYGWVLNQEDPASMEIQDPKVLAPDLEPKWESHRTNRDHMRAERRLEDERYHQRELERYHQRQLAWEEKYYLPEEVRRMIR